jgi:hypothetical protein
MQGGPAGLRERLSALGQRFERSRAGEALISAAVTVVVLIGVVWNLPDSAAKRVVAPTLRPVATASGLAAEWRMYAPDPISAVETLEVHVRMADGGDRMWSFHRGDLVLGPFAWYRWQKLKESAPRAPDIRAGIAHWVVRKLTTPAEHPTRVQMIFRTQEMPPPGNDGPTATKVETLYDEKLTGPP